MKTIRTAMIVDDDEFEHIICRRIIERSGLVENMLFFSLPDQALAYFRDNPNNDVDVVFTDIRMPRMNGFEFLEAAVSEFGPRFVDLVIIMLTTSIDPRDKERAKKLGIVTEYIEKPLDQDDIERIVTFVRDAPSRDPV